MKKPEPIDPKKRFTSVGMQPGQVQQDSDWNRGGSGRSRRRAGSVEQDSDWNSAKGRGLRRWLLPAGGLVVVAAVLVGGLVLARRYGPLLAFRALSGPVANIVTPVQGTVVALHSTVGVTGEGTSGKGIRELQLWVNGQQWASKVFEVPLDQASSTWGWTPSGEGEHLLVVKAIAASGETAESETVRVLAAMAADVRFPANVVAQPGDSLESLAQNYETSAQDIVNSNPGLDPAAPLSPGQTLTVPIPVPNQPEVAPEGGFDPAPPAGEVKPEPGASLQQVAGDYLQAVGAQVASGWRDFKIANGTITPNQPVEKIFLYVSVDDAHYQRIPANEHDYLVSPSGTFDVKPLLQPLLDQSGLDQIKVNMEVWAWRGGSLVFLGSYYGKLTVSDSGPQLTPSSSTELQAVDYVYLSKKFYTQSFAITSAQLSNVREFHWTTSVPGVTYALWQVSTQAFPPGTSLNPPGLIHQGVSSVTNGTFSLRFQDYFTSSQSGGGGLFGDAGDLFDGAQDWFDSLQGKKPPTQTFNLFQPRFFLVRVIPMTGSPLLGDSAAQIAGPASIPVFVYYQWAGNPYKPGLEPNGPVYQATILSFTPLQPADPDYHACFVSTFEVRDCHNVIPGAYQVNSYNVGNGAVVNGKAITPAQFQQCTLIVPKGQESCGCPGVSCSGSSSSCGEISLDGFSDCLSDFGSWAAGALQDAYNFVSGWYNKAVAFVKEWAAKLNPLCIQAKMAAAQFGGDTVTEGDVEDVCQAATDIAVTAVQIYFGIPPSLPNFDQIMDEGLDYAISITATQLGIDCNPQCVALLKKGFSAAASGENLYQAGLDVGASMAAGKLGFPCDAQCQNIVKAGVQGKASFGQVSDAVLDQAAQQITNNLNAQGYPCDEKCHSNIRLALGEGAAVGATAAGAAAQPKPVLLYEPHPLAETQPAMARVSIFRRFESANVPQEDLDHCFLQIFTEETNTLSNGTPVTGAPFIAQALDLPLMKPGQSITIPIVLDHPPGSYFYSSGGASFNWAAFYYGGQIHVRVTGPAFITSGPNAQALPCIAEDTWTATAPK
ncbi:MAG TPA: LysM domain-containing protein [Anaerolineales bacterium]|nr:LysM domain-containing protein [Anaerolineales bacterium]